MIPVLRLALPLLLLGAAAGWGGDDGNQLELREVDLGALGIVMIPEDWEIVSSRPERVEIQSADGKSRVVFTPLQQLAGEPPGSFLERRAQAIGIPVFPRPVSSKWLAGSGVEDAWFVHGTVPHPGADSTGSTFADSTSFKHPSTRYCIIAVYRGRGSTRLLEAWTDHLPEGADQLFNIQRTWRFE